MRRVVAVLGAVLLVVVAVLVRGVIDDDDGSAGGGTDGDGGDGRPGISLVCLDELADVCDELVDEGVVDDVRIEAAGETIDRLAEEGADLGADGWLTLDPFPGIAHVARDVAGLGAYFGEPDRLGHVTAVDVVADANRADALLEACDGDVQWPCVGDLAGDRWDDHGGETSWGVVRVGLDGADSASGLLTAAQAVAGHLGVDDFARNDLDSTDAVRWLARFDRGEDVLRRMVTLRGSFSAVGALDPPTQRLAGTAQGADLGIFYPAPMFQAEALLVAPGGPADDLVDTDRLGEVLAGHGWTEGDGTELPDPGTFYALRDELT